MASPLRVVVYTIGQSTRPVEELAEMLLNREVEVLADTRGIPMSRHNPQFNQQELRESR